MAEQMRDFGKRDFDRQHSDKNIIKYSFSLIRFPRTAGQLAQRSTLSAGGRPAKWRVGTGAGGKVRRIHFL
jgi:hypothetical protein